MPLFGGPSEPLDPQLAPFVGPKAKSLQKIVRKESEAILNVLQPGESIRNICHSDSAFASSVDLYAAIVTTDQRLLIVRKGRYEEFPLDELLDLRYTQDQRLHQPLVTLRFRASPVNIHMTDQETMWSFFSALGREPSFS